MPAFLNWKIVVLVLLVCLLSDIRCAPLTTTRIEYELVCNQTIAAVTNADCQSCGDGCEGEILKAGCYKSPFGNWYSSCMVEMCKFASWELQDDGKHKSDDCQLRCPDFYERCKVQNKTEPTPTAEPNPTAEMTPTAEPTPTAQRIAESTIELTTESLPGLTGPWAEILPVIIIVIIAIIVLVLVCIFWPELNEKCGKKDSTVQQTEPPRQRSDDPVRSEVQQQHSLHQSQPGPSTQPDPPGPSRQLEQPGTSEPSTQTLTTHQSTTRPCSLEPQPPEHLYESASMLENADSEPDPSDAVSEDDHKTPGTSAALRSNVDLGTNDMPPANSNQPLQQQAASTTAPELTTSGNAGVNESTTQTSPAGTPSQQPNEDDEPSEHNSTSSSFSPTSSHPSSSIPDTNNMPPANNINTTNNYTTIYNYNTTINSNQPPEQQSGNAGVNESTTQHSPAETSPQPQNEDIHEPSEPGSTVTSPLLPTTPSHSPSSIPVDASGAGRSTASSSSRHPTLAANASSTLESENLISDQQESAETPVQDSNSQLETVDSDNGDEVQGTPPSDENLTKRIQGNIPAVAEGANETNKSEEIGYQNKMSEDADYRMDENRNEDSGRLDEAAGGPPPVDQHATNSGGVKPSEPLEPIVTVTVPGRTQKDASTGAPTPQDGSPNSSGSLLQSGTKTDGAQHGTKLKKVRPGGGLEMHPVTSPLKEAPKDAPSVNKAEETENPDATTPDRSQQASATTSQNRSPATSQNGSLATSQSGSAATSQNGSTETSPDGSTATSPDGSSNLSRASSVQPGTKTGAGTKVATTRGESKTESEHSVTES